MIGDQTASILRRLSKGSARLDRDAMKNFLLDVRSADVEKVLDQIYPLKTTAKKPSVPTPEWLRAMQKAQKKMSWSMPEAIEQLYSLAAEKGFTNSGARKKSFPTAAKEVALQLGESETKEMFVAWVDDYVTKHVMV